jgi:hypothetical protein
LLATFLQALHHRPLASHTLLRAFFLTPPSEKLRENLIQSLNSAEGMQIIVDMDEHMEQSGGAWPVIL